MIRGHRHISLDFSGCQEIEKLKSRNKNTVRDILALARNAGCTIRKYHFDRFAPEEGYTLVVSISESHFAVITWPERSFINVDIFVCNYTKDNSLVALGLERLLREFFRPKKIMRWEKLRGPHD